MEENLTVPLDDEGNIVWKIYATNDGTIRDYILTDEKIYSPLTDSDPLERGDLVRIRTNSRREIFAMQRAFDKETRMIRKELSSSQKNPSIDELDAIFRLSYCKLLAMKNGNIKVQLYNDANTIEQYFLNGRVLIVDENNDTVRLGSVTDLVSDTSGAASSDIVVEMRYLRIRNIIIYQNKRK